MNMKSYHNKQYIRKFLATCCEGFLTEAELNEMYNGKDWWMDSSEIIQRLQCRMEYYESQQDSEVDCEGCTEDDCQDCANLLD